MHEEVSKDPEMLGRTYSVDAEDASMLMMLLRDEKFIGNEDGAPGSFQLSIKGILEAERLASTFSSYAQAFVAMSFSDAMKSAWTTGFEPALSIPIVSRSTVTATIGGASLRKRRISFAGSSTTP